MRDSVRTGGGDGGGRATQGDAARRAAERGNAAAPEAVRATRGRAREGGGDRAAAPDASRTARGDARQSKGGRRRLKRPGGPAPLAAAGPARSRRPLPDLLSTRDPTGLEAPAARPALHEGSNRIGGACCQTYSARFSRDPALQVNSARFTRDPALQVKAAPLSPDRGASKPAVDTDAVSDADAAR
ncbi:hypothetical protein D1007_04739 [Hordeum vulgare]|nr:hypothetical protein D1007_04739 [Hordeum vulgare]